MVQQQTTYNSTSKDYRMAHTIPIIGILALICINFTESNSFLQNSLKLSKNINSNDLEEEEQKLLNELDDTLDSLPDISNFNSDWDLTPNMKDLTNDEIETLMYLQKTLNNIPNMRHFSKANKSHSVTPRTNPVAPVKPADSGIHFASHPKEGRTINTDQGNLKQCQNLFKDYRSLITDVSLVLEQAKSRPINVNHISIDPTEPKDEFSTEDVLFLKEFLISEGRYQQVLFNTASLKIMVGFKRLKSMTLEDFVPWLKAQRVVLIMLLPLQRHLKKLYDLRYPEIKDREKPLPTSVPTVKTTRPVRVTTTPRSFRFPTDIVNFDPRKYTKTPKPYTARPTMDPDLLHNNHDHGINNLN